MSDKQINITLGTAGHIDHGKTALIKCLTGCETDRLREEKERGMSIELGFAPCRLAGLEVGIVDVPGHENFIKTMVAGAGSMDGVIFVVAADDGVMPQTREHLDILTLLGVRKGVVALTKIDRVDDEEREMVMEDVRAYLAGTFLEHAPILPLSSVTGQGYDAFLVALGELIGSIEPKRADGVFRMPIERGFTIKGHGTVVSGIPVSGAIGMGDEVELLPQRKRGRIRGVQVYGRDAQQAMSGQCAALNIRQWDAGDIGRGCVLAEPGYFEPVNWVVCRLRLLGGEKYTLKNGAQVRFHSGTSETPATVYLLQDGPMENGTESFVQLKLNEPLVMGPGDRFIMRSLSPVRTIGGGTILEPQARRLKRTRAGLADELEAQYAAVGDEYKYMEYCLGACMTAGRDELMRRARLNAAQADKLLAELVAEGRALVLADGLYMHRDVFERAQNRLTEIVGACHQAHPELPGMTLAELEAEFGVVRAQLQPILGLAVQSGVLAEREGRYALPGHQPQFDERERQLMERIEAAFMSDLFHPPGLEELSGKVRREEAECRRALELLAKNGRVVQVEKGLYFHADAVARARSALNSHFQSEKRLESVRFKYMLDTTRKFAIPLLDYFDRIGVTIRVGNTRYLKAAQQAGR